MAEVIRMPRMSDTMTEGVIVSWNKKVGDKVAPGEILAEVETDKATMDLESYQEGTLLYIGVKEGDAVPVEGIIAILGEKGEDYKSLLESESGKSNGTEAKAEPKKEEKKEQPKEQPVQQQKAPQPAQVKEERTVTTETDGRLKASPLAKKMAEEKGIDIQRVKGTGEEGRIVRRDIENYKESAQKAPAGAETQFVIPQYVGEESYEEVNVSQMRKTIARRLAESKFQAPHFYLTMEVNMDKAKAARESVNEISPVKISFNDFVIKAVAMALRQNPKVNASWLGDKIRYNKHIHIGMAVAVEDGLVVPVIKFADNKSLSHISAEAKEFGQKARDKKLQQPDFEGNTFTISNLGMFDIDEFTAIINPPDACIMAIGTIKEIAGVVNGEIKPVNIMKVTLSCDHRVVDGATGARFLQSFKMFLEDPIRLLI